MFRFRPSPLVEANLWLQRWLLSHDLLLPHSKVVLLGKSQSCVIRSGSLGQVLPKTWIGVATHLREEYLTRRRIPDIELAC